MYAGNSATASSGGWYGTRSNHPLYFFTGNGDAQTTLLPSGFFGINTTTPLGTLDVKRIPSSLGTAFFQGTTYGSVFHYSTTEDIYLRGGKSGSHVIINDVAALGNVGVGTDAPVDKLSVRTSSNNYGVTHTDGAVTVGSYVGAGAGWYGTKSNHPLRLFTNNSNSMLEIGTDGRVSIPSGTASSSFSYLTVHGPVTIRENNEWTLDIGSPPPYLLFSFDGSIRGGINHTTGDYSTISDRRLKKNIQPYKNVLPGIRHLEIATYLFNDQNDNRRDLGIIAQNMAEYFPELVNELSDQGKQIYKGIAYGKTGVLALKAIQEQQEIIEALERKIEQLEKRLLAAGIR